MFVHFCYSIMQCNGCVTWHTPLLNNQLNVLGMKGYLEFFSASRQISDMSYHETQRALLVKLLRISPTESILMAPTQDRLVGNFSFSDNEKHRTARMDYMGYGYDTEPGACNPACPERLLKECYMEMCRTSFIE